MKPRAFCTRLILFCTLVFIFSLLACTAKSAKKSNTAHVPLSPHEGKKVRDEDYIIMGEKEIADQGNLPDKGQKVRVERSKQKDESPKPEIIRGFSFPKIENETEKPISQQGREGIQDQIDQIQNTGENPITEKRQQGLEPPSQAKLLENKRPSMLFTQNYYGKPISLDFQNADIRSVLRLIADVSDHNLVIDPEVKGTVNISLIKPVPWDQALEVILRTNKLDMKMEGDIIRVGLPKTFSNEKEEELKRIKAEREAQEVITKAIPLQTKVVGINYAEADKLAIKLNTILSKGEYLIDGNTQTASSASPSIVVDERTNTLIIRAIPEVIKIIMDIIQTLDKPTPQVMIEARIVETKKDFMEDFGIQWGGTYAKETNYRFANSIDVKGATGTGNYAVNLPITSEAFGAIGMNFGHVNGLTTLDIQLKAMEKSGKGRIISNPKIATLNNEQAIIQSGTQIPYQTTDKEGNPVTNLVTASISLTVTPQVTPDNLVTMKIKADKSEPDWSNKVEGAPSILTRSADTKLIIKDGDTAVIGGLNIQNDSSQLRQVPFLGAIPILGYLFKNRDKKENFDEILIFITPTIIEPIETKYNTKSLGKPIEELKDESNLQRDLGDNL